MIIDHVAVKLFLRHRCKLQLFFPCKWDYGKFVDTGESDWRVNPGQPANRYHNEFTAITGCKSLEEIQRAIDAGAIIKTSSGGFHVRNTAIAENTGYMIAFSWSRGDRPTIGGTADVWRKCNTVYKMHVSLPTYCLCNTIGGISVQDILTFQTTLSGITPGSPAYHDLAKRSIGGSQLRSLFGKDNYRTYKELIAEVVAARRGRSEPFSNKFCGWGIAFESVVVAYISRRLACQMYCCNQCIINVPGIPCFRYTPDGIGKVYRTTTGGLWTTAMRREERASADCVLFEIKCPVLRWPKSTVPAKYEPQVQGGLIATEGLTRRCVFVDAMFKLCAETDLGDMPGYNTAFHGDTGWMCSRTPLAWGVLEVYCEQGSVGAPVDYGAMVIDTIEDILCRISTRELTTSLASISFADGVEVKYPRHNMACIGVIPFKLMDIRFVTQERSPFFGVELREKIEQFFRDVDDIQPCI